MTATATYTNMNMKYSLSKFKEIAFHGFNFIIPDENVDLINLLATQVGSQTCVKTPIFQKKEHGEGVIFGLTSAQMNFKLGGNRKRKGNRATEINDDDWESLRTFQATKIEQKNGMDVHIDSIRLLLNKLTDKSYAEIKDKIMSKMDEFTSCEEFTEDVAVKISDVIYDISANNKFFSKIYADLYIEIANKYEFILPMFFKKYDTFKGEFKNIVFADPKVNYDLWCDINTQNERRKAKTQFFVNLAMTGFVSKVSIVETLRELLDTVINMINQTDKKNEVDEITENIAILYNKTIMDDVFNHPDYNEDDFEIEGDSIVDTITRLAKSKAKDFKSLSNKSIFKFMDLIEM